ncbi:MAG: HK97 family phage prohead protease [Lysinibacillus sp.]
MNKRQSYLTSDLQIRSDEEKGDAYIEGYFVVYNQRTELWTGVFEEIAPTALINTLNSGVNVIALDNHDTRIVLGSISSSTLEMKSDDHGLYGRVKIDVEDPFAKSALRKVETGKVKGCSFGFYPKRESRIENDDNTVTYRVEEAELIEVSITAFPAYPQTEIAARQKDIETMKKQKLEQRKAELKERFKR